MKLPVEAAAIWSLLGGYLLLPPGVAFDPHVLPPMDKFSIPAVSTFILCWMKGGPPPRSGPWWFVYLLALAFLLSPIFTALNNSYEIHIGDRSLPGFYPLDGLKMVGHNFVELMPFFLGVRFVSSDRGRALLLKALPAAAVLYSLPMLFELRMSPQLDRIIYGVAPVFAHLWRAGGYRPAVFLSTGLELALFTSMAFVAAVVLARLKWRLFHARPSAGATYLGGLLLLCKSLGAILYGMIAVPLLLLVAPRTWVKIATTVMIIVCAYPMLRSDNLVPVHRIVAAINNINADRAGSLQFRVENEDRLLTKAEEKPLFGWGTWGRNRVFDQGTGTDVSITDGEWILRFGMYGWFGYLSLFGLFAAASFSALIAVKGHVTPSAIVFGGLALILSMNVIDLVPNANLTPLTYLLAGSLAGGSRLRSKVTRVGRLGTEKAAVPA